MATTVLPMRFVIWYRETPASVERLVGDGEGVKVFATREAAQEAAAMLSTVSGVRCRIAPEIPTVVVH